MELHTFSYTKEKSWSVAHFPAIDSSQTTVFIFGAPEYWHDPAPVQELINAYPQAKVIGCSTAGEINGASILDHSLSIAIIKFKDTLLEQIGVEVKTADDSFTAGVAIANKLNSDNLRGIFILSDGININGTQLVKGINSVFSESVVVTGGLAGDGDQFKQTWTICNRRLETNTITAVAFYGDKIQIGHGSKGGWRSFGPERLITHSKNNVLFTLDDKPALELYKEYLGKYAEGLPATGLLFPLAIWDNSGTNKKIVRSIIAVDEKTQSMTFAGDIPTGFKAKLMHANFEHVVKSASMASRASYKEPIALPALAIAISSAGRRLLLKEYAEDETEATLSSFPPGVQQIGFYSYGEIAPYTMTTRHCDFHNQTMTITIFSEVP